jgi:hypothetical protein
VAVSGAVAEALRDSILGYFCRQSMLDVSKECKKEAGLTAQKAQVLSSHPSKHWRRR